MARSRLDLTGRTFGHIEVIAPAGVDSRSASLWQCRCTRCGAIFTVQGHRLTQKRHPTDCGCSYRERTADLTGQQFGGLVVIRRDGSYPSGDRGYVCRCVACGNDKRFPGSTIRTSPKSCGCMRPGRDHMEQISQLGVAANVVDGVNIATANREEANANSTTGLRWVRILMRNGKPFIFAVFFVRGKRYYRGGFESPESAHAWALEEHRRALEQENVPNTRRKTKHER